MDLMGIKSVIGIVAVILVFIGYIPYLRDVWKRKTTPHLYSWFLWGFVTFIVFALQVSDNAGIGAFVTLTAAVMCFVVISASFIRHKGKRDITKVDAAFSVLALISLWFWVGAKQPVLSAVLATSTDLLAFAPTIRKSWKDPHSETLSLYLLNTFRFILATLSLQNYSIITTLYPVSWLVANGLFSLILISRRKKLTNPLS